MTNFIYVDHCLFIFWVVGILKRLLSMNVQVNCLTFFGSKPNKFIFQAFKKSCFYKSHLQDFGDKLWDYTDLTVG